MRLYELVFVVRPSLTEDKRKKIVDFVKDLLKDAKFTKEETMGQKALAYKIKRENSGFFYYMIFEMASIPLDLEKKLLAQENIIRHLLIRNK
ncbi:MAG: 30S ribosomal protein S6 [Patescibacteria group bacterium]|nr:30S ribosomal protein S6 [Patescibacteria group bacterium]